MSTVALLEIAYHWARKNWRLCVLAALVVTLLTTGYCRGRSAAQAKLEAKNELLKVRDEQIKQLKAELKVRHDNDQQYKDCITRATDCTTKLDKSEKDSKMWWEHYQVAMKLRRDGYASQTPTQTPPAVSEAMPLEDAVAAMRTWQREVMR